MARRQSRVLALRALFSMDVGRQPAESALAQALEGEPETFAAYARTLIAGVEAHREEIDALVRRFSRGWSVGRLAAVDRNVLRIAVYELQNEPAIPANAVVSEAVALAGIYSTEESPRFVNGILAAIAGEIGRGLEEGAVDHRHRQDD